MFQKTLEDGTGGRQCRLLFCVVQKKEDVTRGQVLAKPGSITPHTDVRGRGLHPLQGRGWTSLTFLQHGYRPQFYFRTTDVTGNTEVIGCRHVHAR